MRQVQTGYLVVLVELAPGVCCSLRLAAGGDRASLARLAEINKLCFGVSGINSGREASQTPCVWG